MRMRFKRVCALMLAVLGAGSVTAQTSTDTVYHVHGSVLNGVTGRPIGRALVVSADRRLATMTNSEGQFSLDVSVPAASAQPDGNSVPNIGMYSGPGPAPGAGIWLNAQRPGFLPSRRGTSIALSANLDTQSVILRLMPAATIRGRIVATGSDSLRGLRLQLLRRSMQDGRPGWQMSGSHPVSEDGVFQFIDLQPGEYTLVTSEWSPRIFSQMTMPPVSQQYPPDFLGDTSTLESATKLRLGYGQSIPANLHLRAAPYYSVTLPVQGLPPGAGASVRIASGAGFRLYQLGWNNRDAAVEGALPDGDYLVVVNTFGAQRSGAQIPLHVAGAPVVHAPVGMTPLEDVVVSVRDERTQSGSDGSGMSGMASGSASSSLGFFLSARSEDSEGGGMAVMQNSPTGPVIRGLMPGRYYLQGAGMGRGYIASLTCDGVNLLTNALVVNDSGHTAPIQATLRDDGGTIAGTVDMTAGGLQAARILILPTDESGHVMYSYAASNGRFEVSNVPPGSYRVLAVPADQPDLLPYRDPQAMRAYNSRGGSVSVAAGQTAQVEAELVGADGTDVQR